MSNKTLFGLVPNEAKIFHLVERLEAAHLHDISLIKLNETPSRGSMDEQRHEGDARHHKYEEKIHENKHRAHHLPLKEYENNSMSEMSSGSDMSEMTSIDLPNLGQCQCSGTMEQELREAAGRKRSDKSPLCASLINYGLPDNEAHRFEDFVKSGQILICVHSTQSEDLENARDILKKEGIKELSFSQQK